MILDDAVDALRCSPVLTLFDTTLDRTPTDVYLEMYNGVGIPLL